MGRKPIVPSGFTGWGLSRGLIIRYGIYNISYISIMSKTIADTDRLMEGKVPTKTSIAISVHG